jgi:hypothetical protein
MRRYLLLLSFMMIFNCSLFSQNDETLRIRVIDKIENNSKAAHAPAKTPVECYYYPTRFSLELSFLVNMGSVDVLLENLSSGEIQDYSSDSVINRMVIPVEANTAYRMEITTEYGHNYYADFFTSSEVY